jgi:hypothetical protein
MYLVQFKNICLSFGNMKIAMHDFELQIRRCIQKFPDWFDNEIYVYNNKHSIRSNIKGYIGKTQ